MPVVLVGCNVRRALCPLTPASTCERHPCRCQSGRAGVLVVLNDDPGRARRIENSYAAAPDFPFSGLRCARPCGHDAIAFYRRPPRRCYPTTAFDVRTRTLPRVISHAYAGADGADVRVHAAGAEGSFGRFRSWFRRTCPRRLCGAVAQASPWCTNARWLGPQFRGKRLSGARLPDRRDNRNRRRRALAALALIVTTDPTTSQMFRPTEEEPDDPSRIDLTIRST